MAELTPVGHLLPIEPGETSTGQPASDRPTLNEWRARAARTSGPSSTRASEIKVYTIRGYPDYTQKERLAGPSAVLGCELQRREIRCGSVMWSTVEAYLPEQD